MPLLHATEGRVTGRLEARSGAGEHPFVVTTLDSGLRVAAIPQPQLHRAHVALYVRVGSRFETDAENGLSHFLEHMLYRGTPRLATAHDVNFAFESLGGYLYAATQTDYGVFSVTVPPESLAEATALFGEVLAHPTFRDIEIEKGIVCEEILEDLDDDGRQIDPDNLSRKLIYPSHPLGFTITGDETRVRSFDEAMLKAHHGRHYNAENAVLVFSGAIDPDHARDLAAAAFAGLPRGQRVAAEPPAHAQRKPRLQVVENVSSQTELRVSFRALPQTAETRASTEMLMRLLDDGMSTRLYHRICDAKGLCYDVGASYDGYEDDGVLDFMAGVQHARASVVTREILELVSELARGDAAEDEMQKARRRSAWDLRAALDSPEETAALYAEALLFDRFETPEARLAASAAVTPDAIRDLVAQLATPERLNVVAVGLLAGDERARMKDIVKGYAAP